MKRRYSNDAVVQRSGGGEGTGTVATLVFSVTVLYLTENLWASALLFVTGMLVVNGGLLELLYLFRRPTKRKGSTAPLHHPKNFVTPYGENEHDD